MSTKKEQWALSILQKEHQGNYYHDRILLGELEQVIVTPAIKNSTKIEALKKLDRIMGEEKAPEEYNEGELRQAIDMFIEQRR